MWAVASDVVQVLQVVQAMLMDTIPTVGVVVLVEAMEVEVEEIVVEEMEVEVEDLLAEDMEVQVEVTHSNVYYFNFFNCE